MATEKKVLVRHGEELCKVANDKFGYYYGLKLTLEHLGFDERGVKSILLKTQKPSNQKYPVRYHQPQLL